MAKVIEVEIEVGSKQALKTLNDLETAQTQLLEQLKQTEVGTEEYRRLQKQLKTVANQVKDLELGFEALDKEQRATAIVDTFTGVAGAITAATGALTLFGVESEDLAVVEKRILGLLAVTSGLRDISNGIVAANKVLGPSFIEVGNSIKTAFTTGTVAAQTFKAALAALGIGLLIAGITELITNFDKIKQAITGIDPAVEELTNKWKEQEQAIKDAGDAALAAASTQYNQLGNRLRDVKESGGDLSAVFEDIKKVIPETNSITLDQADAYDKLDKAVIKYSRNQEEVIKRDNLIKEVGNLIQQQVEATDKGYFDLAKSLRDKTNAARAEITSLNISINSYDLFNQQLLKNIEIQKQQEAQRKANAAKAKAEADERKKRAEQTAKEVELIGLSEVENARILAKREFDERIKGFKEGSEQYKNALLLYNEELRQIEVKAAEKRVTDTKAAEDKFKTDTETEYQATLTSTEAFYQQERNLLAQQFLNKEIDEQTYNEKIAAIDQQSYQSRLVINEDYGKDNLEVTSDYLDQQVQDQIDANAASVKSTEDAEKAKAAARDQGFQIASGVLNSLSGLFEQGSKQQKALALAAIEADTARALTSALANSNAPTPDNVATGGLAGIAKYATLAITILGNAARAKQVLETKQESAGKPPSAPSAPSAPAGPVATFGGGAPGGLFDTTTQTLNNQASSGGVFKTYVLAGDVANGLEANQQIQRRRKF